MPFSETYNPHPRFLIMTEVQVGTSMFTTIWLTPDSHESLRSSVMRTLQATWSVCMLRHKWAVCKGGQNALNKPHSNQTQAEYTGKHLSLHIPLATLWIYLSSSPSKSVKIRCWFSWPCKDYFEILSEISSSSQHSKLLSLKEFFRQDEIKHFFLCIWTNLIIILCIFCPPEKFCL